MEAPKIALTQKCCDWQATAVACQNLVDMPYDMVEVLSKEDAKVLGDACGTIAKSMPDGPMCNTTASVLLTKDELQVLATVIEWFEGHLAKIKPKLPVILHERHSEKVAQLKRIKFKLQVHESTFNAN